MPIFNSPKIRHASTPACYNKKKTATTTRWHICLLLFVTRRKVGVRVKVHRSTKLLSSAAVAYYMFPATGEILFVSCYIMNSHFDLGSTLKRHRRYVYYAIFVQKKKTMPMHVSAKRLREYSSSSIHVALTATAAAVSGASGSHIPLHSSSTIIIQASTRAVLP